MTNIGTIHFNEKPAKEPCSNHFHKKHKINFDANVQFAYALCETGLPNLASLYTYTYGPSCALSRGGV